MEAENGDLLGIEVKSGTVYPDGEALARECREEIALETVNARVRTAVTHAYPDRTIRLTLIDCEPVPEAEPVALEHEALGWYTPDEMQTLDFCPADAELLPVLFEEC
ncbi:MAG: 8-oxo-dGTP diphosphatase MutT [Kiritimatiellae bacterium]|nr:8-oxo-dGTP diphosphatase MutT [Kiritimatiellia bacterium]